MKRSLKKTACFGGGAIVESVGRGVPFGTCFFRWLGGTRVSEPPAPCGLKRSFVLFKYFNMSPLATLRQMNRLPPPCFGR